MPTERTPRALVSGGAGFLGSYVCEALLVDAFEVVCVDNFVTSSAHNIETLIAEPQFTMLTRDFSQGCPEVGDIDLVLHLASPALPTESIRAANQGTWYALDIARRCDARFVLASTAHMYGAAGGHRLREIDVDPMNPTDAGPIGVDSTRAAYDSARFAEALTMAYRKAFHTDTGILRVFDTYGPAMATVDARVVPTFIRQALAGEALTETGDGHQVRSLCYVEDTVRAIVAMGASLHPGPINVGSPAQISIRHLAEHVLRLTGSSAGIRFVERQPEDLRHAARRCRRLTRCWVGSRGSRWPTGSNEQCTPTSSTA